MKPMNCSGPSSFRRDADHSILIHRSYRAAFVYRRCRIKTHRDWDYSDLNPSRIPSNIRVCLMHMDRIVACKHHVLKIWVRIFLKKKIWFENWTLVSVVKLDRILYKMEIAKKWHTSTCYMMIHVPKSVEDHYIGFFKLKMTSPRCVSNVFLGPICLEGKGWEEKLKC